MTSLRQALMLEGQGVVSLVGAGGKTSLMFKLAHEIAETGESVLTTTTTKILVPEPKQSSCLIVSDSVETIVKQASDFHKNRKLHLTAAKSQLPGENKLIGLTPETIDAIFEKGIFRWILVEADGAAGRPLKVPANHEPVIPPSTKLVIGLAGLSGVGKPLTDEWVHRLERFILITGLAAGQEITAAAVCSVILHDKGIFKDAPVDAARLVILNQADMAGGFETGKQIGNLLAMQKKTKLKRIIIGQLEKEPPVLEYYDMNC
ncbi:MAG: selenium cofactor biosynthesis protein YqeC [Desulfobacterales bacterium]|jgi:probable selenium-dependent hydroxylase accessory protein YqeC